jgi:hypothetical protein
MPGFPSSPLEKTYLTRLEEQLWLPLPNAAMPIEKAVEPLISPNSDVKFTYMLVGMTCPSWQ